MSYNKRGLKRVEDDLDHEGYNPVIDEGRGGRGKSPPSGMDILLRPFGRDDEAGKPQTSLSVGVLTFLLTFIGCMLFATVYLTVLANQTGDATAFIVSLVAGVLTVGPMMWTFDTDARVHTIPGIIVANIGTLDLGILPALAFLVAQFGGYAVGGVITRAIWGVQTVADAATGTAAYWLAWACTSVIVFQYIYNDKFEFHREYEVSNHSRAAVWTGVWSFGFRLAFYSLGLRSLNSGLYLAALILSNDSDLTPADGVVDWAFHIFVPLFASAATAFLLYYLASFFIRFKDVDLVMYARRAYRKGRPDYDEVSSKVAGRYGADVRSRSGTRKLDADF